MSSAATEVLRRIACLYAIESAVRGHSTDERQKVHEERSRPIVDDLHRYIEARSRPAQRPSP